MSRVQELNEKIKKVNEAKKANEAKKTKKANEAKKVKEANEAKKVKRSEAFKLIKKLNTRLNNRFLESLDVTKIKVDFEVYKKSDDEFYLVVFDSDNTPQVYSDINSLNDLTKALETLENDGYEAFAKVGHLEEDDEEFLKDITSSQSDFKLIANNDGLYLDSIKEKLRSKK